PTNQMDAGICAEGRIARELHNYIGSPTHKERWQRAIDHQPITGVMRIHGGTSRVEKSSPSASFRVTRQTVLILLRQITARKIQRAAHVRHNPGQEALVRVKTNKVIPV